MEVNPQYPDQTTKLSTTWEKHLIELRGSLRHVVLSYLEVRTSFFTNGKVNTEHRL